MLVFHPSKISGRVRYTTMCKYMFIPIFRAPSCLDSSDIFDIFIGTGWSNQTVPTARRTLSRYRSQASEYKRLKVLHLVICSHSSA